MAISVSHFNLEPNREWFFKVIAGASSTTTELYLSESDAQSSSNRVAHSTHGFGTEIPVTLTQDESSDVDISFFQDEISYHLKVTSAANDGTKIFRLKPFTDLSTISHSIYRNFDIAQHRAYVEISKHANVRFSYELNLGICTTTVIPTDQVILSSELRGLPGITVQIATHRISGTKDQLLSDLTCYAYRPMVIE